MNWRTARRTRPATDGLSGGRRTSMGPAPKAKQRAVARAAQVAEARDEGLLVMAHARASQRVATGLPLPLPYLKVTLLHPP